MGPPARHYCLSLRAKQTSREAKAHERASLAACLHKLHLFSQMFDKCEYLAPVRGCCVWEREYLCMQKKYNKNGCLDKVFVLFVCKIDGKFFSNQCAVTNIHYFPSPFSFSCSHFRTKSLSNRQQLKWIANGVEFLLFDSRAEQIS